MKGNKAEYVVPLRREWLKASRFKRAKKAINALKQFIAKHAKVEEKNVKVDRFVNMALWARGIRKPPHKIKVIVEREEVEKEGKKIIIAKVSFSGLPKSWKVEEEKIKRLIEKAKKKKEEKKKKEAIKEGKKEEEEKKKQEKEEEKEKILKETEKVLEKELKKKLKHEAPPKQSMPVHRKALEK